MTHTLADMLQWEPDDFLLYPDQIYQKPSCFVKGYPVAAHHGRSLITEGVRGKQHDFFDSPQRARELRSVQNPYCQWTATEEPELSIEHHPTRHKAKHQHNPLQLLLVLDHTPPRVQIPSQAANLDWNMCPV